MSNTTYLSTSRQKKPLRRRMHDAEGALKWIRRGDVYDVFINRKEKERGEGAAKRLGCVCLGFAYESGCARDGAQCVPKLCRAQMNAEDQ